MPDRYWGINNLDPSILTDSQQDTTDCSDYTRTTEAGSSWAERHDVEKTNWRYYRIKSVRWTIQWYHSSDSTAGSTDTGMFRQFHFAIEDFPSKINVGTDWQLINFNGFQKLPTYTRITRVGQTVTVARRAPPGCNRWIDRLRELSVQGQGGYFFSPILLFGSTTPKNDSFFASTVNNFFHVHMAIEVEYRGIIDATMHSTNYTTVFGQTSLANRDVLDILNRPDVQATLISKKAPVLEHGDQLVTGGFPNPQKVYEVGQYATDLSTGKTTIVAGKVVNTAGEGVFPEDLALKDDDQGNTTSLSPEI